MLTHQQAEKRLEGRPIKLVSSFTKVTDKHQFQCLVCDKMWSSTLNNIFNGKGCPRCGHQRSNESKMLSPKEVAKRTSAKGVRLLEPYRAQTKLRYKCLAKGHSFETRVLQGCPECSRIKLGLSRRRTVPWMREMLKKKAPSLKILTTSCSSAESLVRVQCLKCKHVWRATWRFDLGQGKTQCKKCFPKRGGTSKDEKLVRQILESKIFPGRKFSSVRPQWLKTRKGKLEIDCYNSRLRLGVEVQGPRHFLPINGISQLRQVQANDNRKSCRCRYKGVHLIRISYKKIAKGAKHIETYLRTKLAKLGFSI